MGNLVIILAVIVTPALSDLEHSRLIIYLALIPLATGPGAGRFAMGHLSEFESPRVHTPIKS